MKNIYSLLLISISIYFCCCQISSEKRFHDSNSDNDKKVIEEDKIKVDSLKYLSGTTVLPWTKNQQIAKGYGLYLDAVKVGKCDNTKQPPEREEIVSILEADSTLIIQTKIIGNCCHDFLCDVEIIEERKINLIQYGYGKTYCSCTCSFDLTYKFSTMRIKEFERLEMIMLNGDEKTSRKK